MSECERLMNDFTENYMEKLFYFCLRKTGNIQDAEDLTQTVSLAILSELHRGVIPERFSGWVWQIAQNQYAKWADRKHKRSLYETGIDIGDYELAEDKTLRDEYEMQESLSLLRRELAFIREEYRRIIVAYYIEDRSIKDIAASLFLPEGTVKSKLFRAKNILKEGMNMAREFGKLSYKPEDIRFTKNGRDGNDGTLWSIVNRKLCKNILLAAYRTPSTAEELAIELGIALPYMEDELDRLVNATLMKKNGNKYETSFVIVSAKAQERIAENLSKITPPFAEALIKALEYRTKCLDMRDVKWHRGYQDYEDMKWALLMLLTDRIASKAVAKSDTANSCIRAISRPNGGAWDIIGLEEYKGRLPEFVGKHGGNNEKVDFWQFKFQYKDIDEQTPTSLSETESMVLLSVIENDTDGLFQGMLDDLTAYGYLKKTDRGYIPTFAVYNGNIDRMLNEQESNEYQGLCNTAIDIALEHYKFCCNVILSEIPDFLRSDQHQIDFACSTVLRLRGAIFEEALRTGYLTYGGGKTEARDRMLGAYIVV